MNTLQIILIVVTILLIGVSYIRSEPRAYKLRAFTPAVIAIAIVVTSLCFIFGVTGGLIFGTIAAAGISPGFKETPKEEVGTDGKKMLLDLADQIVNKMYKETPNKKF